MGLQYGWRSSGAIVAAWWTDDAFTGPACRRCGATGAKLDGACEQEHASHDVIDQRGARLPAGVVEAWSKDGYTIVHLAPFAAPGATPDRIVYRPLTSDEAAYCEGLQQEGDGIPGVLRAALAAFRIAVSFPDAPEFIGNDKARRPVGTVGPFTGLAEPFVAEMLSDPWLAQMVRGIGTHVYLASRPTNAEKKASSRPSTPSKSSPATALPSTKTEAPAAASDATTSTPTSTG